MNLLWLPGWYPVKTDPYNGDFIQRHARAVAGENFVQVIYVVRDEKGVVTKDIHMEESVSGNLKEKIIYYYFPKNTFRLLDKFFSARIYSRLYKQAVVNYLQKEGLPKVVNVHIAMKAGLIARWIYKKWKIPYVISEQWTAYLGEAQVNARHWPFYYYSLWKKVMRDASAFSVVSDYLGKSIEKILPGFRYTVIPNVVDTGIFKPAGKRHNEITRFIHISGLGHQKNPEDILKAFSYVVNTGVNAEMVMVGPNRPDLIGLTGELGLQGKVQFIAEMPQEELVTWIQESDALILYSRYETFGCVIIEAQACGKPAILSDLPVMHENATEGINAVFAGHEDPEALSRAMHWFMNNKEGFDPGIISGRAAKRYNFQTVGRQFTAWYQNALASS